MRRVFLTIVVVLAVASGIAATASADAQRGNPNPGIVFRPGSHPFGLSYHEWAADWLEWILETPTADNPLSHPEKCGPGESRKAWFLPGSILGPIETTCTVPAGKGILVSPAGALCSPAVGDPPDNLVAPCIELARQFTIVRVTLDGRDLRKEKRYLVASRIVHVRIPAANPFGLPAQETPAVVVGEFLMFRPLRPGEHTITLFGQMPGSDPARATFHIRVQ
jgi:hypothetical protein